MSKTSHEFAPLVIMKSGEAKYRQIVNKTKYERINYRHNAIKFCEIIIKLFIDNKIISIKQFIVLYLKPYIN